MRLNLVINASHAIQSNHNGSRGRITVVTGSFDDHVLVSVQDDGGGVPKHLAERVFEPLSTTKEFGKGTGQGLAMARRSIVDRHGGSLDLEVEEGIGSRFVITLPVRATAAD